MSRRLSSTAAILLVVLLPLVGAAQPREVAPALNEPNTDVPPGERPYEMVWAKRTEKRSPLIAFEDLAGWTVETY